ncbi:MAG: TAXI family TRAP transporter solute-binding subunit [Desulfobacteraceae bacterium]|nr:MAG: TAXI family TRAP transporter solute-binding subunit [Desulfobacteraceae bacterium]
MKRRVPFLTILSVLALVFALAGSADAQKKRFFGIATGGTGGVYYPLGGASAQCLSSKIADMIVTAQSGNASAANVNLIARNEVESGLAQNNVALAAWTGDKESWKTPPVPKLRGIASMYPETTHFVALKKSGIKTVHDFKGKRIIVGDKGSGTEFDSRRILDTMGLSYNDIEPVFVYYATAVQRLQDEQADAVIWTSGVPNANMIEIATTKEVVFLDFPEDLTKKIGQKYPYYAPVTIPAKIYQHQPNEVKTIGIIALWVTSADVTEKDVYDVTYNFWEATPLLHDTAQKDKVSCATLLANVHKQGENVKMETALLGMTVPLHAGAYKYYKEKGVKVPDNLIPPEAKK